MGFGAGTPIIVIVATIPFCGDVAAGVALLSITETVGVSVGDVAVTVIRTVFALFVGTERETV